MLLLCSKPAAVRRRDQKELQTFLMSKIVMFFVVVSYCIVRILIVVLAVLCRCSGSVLPAVCLISAGYVSCNSSLAVFLLTAAIGFSGISYVCWSVNALDLAPQFAGESALDISSVSKPNL